MPRIGGPPSLGGCKKVSRRQLEGEDANFLAPLSLWGPRTPRSQATDLVLPSRGLSFFEEKILKVGRSTPNLYF